MKDYFENKSDYATVFIRLALGSVMLAAGIGKVMGGSEMLAGAAAMFGMPVFMMWVAAYAELLGGLLVLIGYKTRVAAFFLAVTMLVATILVAWNGAAWMGQGNFWAWPFTHFLMAMSLMYSGAKVLSID